MLDQLLRLFIGLRRQQADDDDCDQAHRQSEHPAEIGFSPNHRSIFGTPMFVKNG